MTSQLDIINRALTEIAARQPIVNLTDSAAGVAAAQLYQPAVETLLRQEDFEFSRTDQFLVDTGRTAPFGYLYTYLYPADCLRIRQIHMETWDHNDPQPVTWTVGKAFDVPNTPVIWCNLPPHTTGNGAAITYTTNAVTEDEWDSIFTEMVVRYLGSMLILPVGGRPDFARELLGQAGGLGGAGRDRDS